jgi:large-conductance mechanosensitive channel
MDVHEFAANYARFGDDELLCLWADRNTLVPEATMALDSELQRRGLKKQNATGVKKRLDMPADREEKGPRDDTPKGFLEEVRTSILRKRVGQIALAVVLAQSVWRLISALTWYLLMPAMGRFFNGNTESVLSKSYRHNPIPWQNVAGSLVEFGFTVIAVFYLNRWIHQKPRPAVEPEVSGETFAPQTEASVVHDTSKS